jgi:hypothetical protein
MPLKPGNSWIQVVPLDFEIEIDGQAHTRLGDEAQTVQPESTVGRATATAVPSATLTPIGLRPSPTSTATAESE